MTTRFERQLRGFTLIELLVVISIIALLISILLPSLSRARDQSKAVHCLARLKEFGNALGTYENFSSGTLPPASWFPDEKDYKRLESDAEHSSATQPQPVEYGWEEILFRYVYQEEIHVPESFPVQRNVEARRWEKYFRCKAAGDEGTDSGHYRVYLPAWAGGNYRVERADGRWDETVHIDPRHAARRENIRPKLPIMGDSNEFSERGDGVGLDDCSYIDAGEANYAGSDGRNGNRFSDRHSGGTNYLWQDLHAEWNTQTRGELARDYDLNGVNDIALQP